MVFFNCNACGESLKKNQVEKHYQFQCRKCEVLSCVDCSKEFWGDDYKEHTKCISEDEKYSGKNYKPKPSANKGEAKQEAWIEQVQQAVDKTPTSNPRLRALLQQLIDYPNIPRKQAKFMNFLSNSLRMRDTKLAAQTWDMISAEMNKQKQDQDASHIQNGNADQSQNGIADTHQSANMTEAANHNEPTKQSKRERKEERRKKSEKTEKKDKKKKQEEEETSVKKKEGKKKRKRQEEEEEELVADSTEEGKEGNKKVKKWKRNTEDEEPDTKEVELDTSQTSDESVQQMEPPGKFRWEAAVIGSLEAASDNQLSIKRLRKKVLAECAACGGNTQGKSEEQWWAKLEKKISRHPRLKVLKDRVTLVQ